MDSFKKLLRINSVKENPTITRRKLIRRSRSLPLKETITVVQDYDRAVLRGKGNHFKSGSPASSEFGELDTLVDSDGPDFSDPNFVLDISPEKCPSDDFLKNTVTADSTANDDELPATRSLGDILELFPDPPSSFSPSASAFRVSPYPYPPPADRHELSKLCGLPAEDLLPLNPHVPWIPPSVLFQELSYDQATRDRLRREREEQGRLQQADLSRMYRREDEPLNTVPDSTDNEVLDITDFVAEVAEGFPTECDIPVNVAESDGLWGNNTCIYLAVPPFTLRSRTTTGSSPRFEF
ncbi:hypothetical protein ONZ45_g4342 [Pleurotus djamor]|nr:hypothetical protein ONZ45_g4342 [Pleurotus djamor]